MDNHDEREKQDDGIESIKSETQCHSVSTSTISIEDPAIPREWKKSPPSEQKRRISLPSRPQQQCNCPQVRMELDEPPGDPEIGRNCCSCYCERCRIV